jgi:flagellar hook assembly protein FlgD
MVIYDVRGKQVRTVVDGVLPGGDHSIPWNGRDDSGHEAANGVYFCRVKAGTVQETFKMIQLQ